MYPFGGGHRAVIQHYVLQAACLILAKAHRHRLRTESDRAKNRIKSQGRANVEQAFWGIKRIVGWTNVRYRGMAKNTKWPFISCILANWSVLRQRHLAGMWGTIHFGKHEVKDDEIGTLAYHEFLRLDTGLGDAGMKPLLFEIELDQLRDLRLIFDDQNLLWAWCRHSRLLRHGRSAYSDDAGSIRFLCYRNIKYRKSGENEYSRIPRRSGPRGMCAKADPGVLIKSTRALGRQALRAFGGKYYGPRSIFISSSANSMAPRGV